MKIEKGARKVATSTNEAELQALSYASKHMIWLQEGLSELKVSQQQPIMYGDNQGTLTLMRSQKINDFDKTCGTHISPCSQSCTRTRVF